MTYVPVRETPMEAFGYKHVECCQHYLALGQCKDCAPDGEKEKALKLAFTLDENNLAGRPGDNLLKGAIIEYLLKHGDTPLEKLGTGIGSSGYRIEPILKDMISHKAGVRSFQRKATSGKMATYYSVDKPTEVKALADNTTAPLAEGSYTLPDVNAVFVMMRGKDMIISPAAPSGKSTRERALEEQLETTKSQLEMAKTELEEVTKKYEEVAGVMKALRDLSL